MVGEAQRAYPQESGGILMGYWVVQPTEAVITDVIGPGPGAIHRDTSFLPDAEYQADQVARRYEASGRLHTYLGDWHSHPNAGPHLSDGLADLQEHLALAADAYLDPKVDVVNAYSGFLERRSSDQARQPSGPPSADRVSASRRVPETGSTLPKPAVAGVKCMVPSLA